MIGDSPNTDIKGANNVGWDSILVRSGIYKESGNSQEFPAKYVFDNVLEAVEFILKTEKIVLADKN